MQMSINNNKIRRTAYHEAGHTVMTHLCDKSFKYVTLNPEPKENSLGHIRFARVRSEMENYNRSITTVIKNTMIHLAGHIAEEILLGKKLKVTGAYYDFQNIADEILGVVSCEQEQKQFLAWLRTRTLSTLSSPVNWEMVENLAEELLRYKRLTRSEVLDLWFPETKELRRKTSVPK